MAKKSTKPTPSQAKPVESTEKPAKVTQSPVAVVTQETPKVENVKQTSNKPQKTLSKSDISKIEEKEKAERVQVFGLYFHNSKTLSTFLFFAIGIIIVPLFTYLKSFDYLHAQPEITKNQAQMYSGFISVGVVILFMIGYCVVAITDESNFSHEERQYNLLSESEKKSMNQSKLREAFEENALENGITEVVKKPNSKKANPNVQEPTKAKKEVKEEHIDAKKQPLKGDAKGKQEEPTKPKEAPKVVAKAPEKPVEAPKKDKSDKTNTKKSETTKVIDVKEVKKAAPAVPEKKPEPSKTIEVKDPKKAAPVVAEKNPDLKTKNSKKGEKAVQTPVIAVPVKVTPKLPASFDSEDDWNVVKVTTTKKASNINEKSEGQKKTKEEKAPASPTNVSENSDSDGFIVVKQKKASSAV